MSTAISVRNVTHDYGDRRALDGVSFEVGEGEIFGLLGPNGGGKSTLFRVLATLLPVHGGSAEVCGRDVASAPAGVRSVLGVTFQSPSLDGKLKVGENLRHHGH
ncbi:MAG: ATP-binding cassette domain-containing protein, partial [Planctomycetota bacterium]